MVRPMTAEDLWRLPRVGAPAVGGKTVVVPVTTYDLADNKGRTRLWRLNGSDLVALTRDDADSTQPSVSPDGEMIAFLRSGEGDRRQLHVMTIGGGEPEEVTDLPLGASGARWLPDGSGLIVVAPLLRGHPTIDATRSELAARQARKSKALITEDATYRYWDTWLIDGEMPHLFRVDLDSRSTRLLTSAERWWTWPSWEDPLEQFDLSPDGRLVAYSANTSSPPHRILHWGVFTIGVEDGEERFLTPEATGHCLRPRFSPDGALILYGMQRELDFYADRLRLVTFDRADLTHTVLTEEWDRSAAGWEFAADGTLYLTAEDGGRQNLYRLEGEKPQVVVPGGTLTAIRPMIDDSVFFLAQGHHQPPEVAVLRTDGKVETVTSFTDEAMDHLDLGEVEEIWLDGYGGEQVQMYVTYPPGFDPARRWPLVHMIHGGPHGIFGDGWHWRWSNHCFAARGYVVAQVNFHGSTSWGQEFTTSIQGQWGNQPTADVQAATDHLIARGFIDEERMAIAGGSYGGYLVAWLASQTDRYVCGVAHAAVTNLPGMYASDVTYGRRRSYGAEVWEDLARVEQWSPAAHSSGYRTPLLVVHGERDYRVPVTQGLELYGVLRAKGVEARLVYYPDENHWVLSPANSLHWYGEVLAWFNRYLK